MNSSENINHKPCPFTDCGSSDAFSYNTDGYGRCHSCGQSYPHKGMSVFDWASQEYPLSNSGNANKSYTPKGITIVKPQLVEANVTPKYVTYRGITPKTREFFKALVYLDSDENLTKTEYVYGDGTVKTRVHPKEFYTSAGFKSDQLYGMNLFPAGSAKAVTICEGEEDAMSAYQMLGGYPVVSLPSATPSRKLLENCKDWLNSFEKIYLSLDADNKADKFALALIDLFPGRIYKVGHGSYKDANDFLQAGKVEQYKKSWWGASKYTPENFISSPEQWEKVLTEERPYEYVPTPIDDLNKVVRGFIKGGITILKALPGTGKCLGPDQLVMKFDGSLVKAKDVQVGDLLMGDDSTPRTVLSVCEGEEEMFEITPVKGDSWVCNKSHILTLQHCDGGVQDIALTDYLAKSDSWKHKQKQFRVPVEAFATSHVKDVNFDPYVVGVYLGDGHTHRCAISVGDKKEFVRQYVMAWAHSNGYTCRVVDSTNCKELQISNNWHNPFWSFIKGVVNGVDRHIPDAYKYGTWSVRKDILTGLLDTDGHVSNGCVEITQKSETLADDIVFVARSLGLAAYKQTKRATIKSLGFEGTYYRVTISGDLSNFEFLRLSVEPRKQIKSVLRTGFSVKSLGVGKYNGFTLDGNGRFLLGDFTVTHNTDIFRYWQHDLVVNKGARVAVLHMEEMKSTTGRGLVTYHLKKNVRTIEDAQRSGVAEEEVIRTIKELTADDKFISFEIDPSDPMESVLSCIRTAIAVYNVDFIFIDHLQRLAYLAGVDNATAALTELAVKMVDLTKRKNVGIIAISHVNESGAAKYAKAIEEEAIVILEVERDRFSNDAIARNTTVITVSKNRPFSILGDGGKMYYDPETTTIGEPVDTW